MPTFTYTAIDVNTGREQRGSVPGADEADAAAGLKARGLYPVALDIADSDSGSVSRTGSSAAALSGRPGWFRTRPGGRLPGRRELTVFTRQLATLVRAGMPLLRGLEVLGRQQPEGPMREVITEVAETIRTGGSLSDGLARHPRVFDGLYVSMVRAGEAGGALDTVLDRLAEFLEKSRRLRGRVKAALTYPVVILTVAAVVVGVLVVLVIPRFESIFANLLKGQPLPALTRAVLGVSEGVQAHLGWIVLALVLGVLVGRWGLRRPAAALHWDGLKLRLPVLGEVVRKTVVARFARTLATLLGAGVPILSALQITRDTAGNRRVSEAIDGVALRVRAGEGVAAPLAAAGVFPAMVQGMVEVGEETGRLPDMLERIADTFDEEVDHAVSALTSLLEPVMIVLMAGVVGTMVLALFLPLVRIVQGLS